MFIGREEELRKLEEQFDGNSFEFSVIYGRKKVGKTALISEFIKDKKAIYCPTMEANEKQNLEIFSQSIMSVAMGTSTNIVFRDFQDAFEYVGQIAKEERLVFVIDNYPHLDNCYSKISSLLTSMIEDKWIHSKLMLILCGSSVSDMENKVLGAKSPFKGKITAEMKVLPFTFAECRQYYRKFNRKDMALAYGMSGGIPAYMDKFDENKSMEANIKANFFDTSAYLFEEPANLLRQEFREPMHYNAILKAIATGSTKISEISLHSGLCDTSATSNYMSKLMALGLVEKIYPHQAKSTKKTVYRITDGMVQFWYQFIPDNMPLIGVGAKDRVYDRVEGQISAYMGTIFEEMCKQYLCKENDRGDLPVQFTSIGKWWGIDPANKQQTQVDILADNEQNEAIFVKCKWSEEEMTEDDLNELRHQSTLFHYKKTVLMLFSMNGFSKECRKLADTLENINLIDYNSMEWN